VCEVALRLAISFAFCDAVITVCVISVTDHGLEARIYLYKLTRNFFKG